jgi:hypothetical protein
MPTTVGSVIIKNDFYLFATGGADSFNPPGDSFWIPHFALILQVRQAHCKPHS